MSLRTQMYLLITFSAFSASDETEAEKKHNQQEVTAQLATRAYKNKKIAPSIFKSSLGASRN